MKLVVSLMLMAQDSVYPRPTLEDVADSAVPACLYTINNWLLLSTLQQIDAGVFAVVRETNLFFTAVIWAIAFKASLGHVRLACIVAIGVSCVVSQLSAHAAASPGDAHRIDGPVMRAFL